MIDDKENSDAKHAGIAATAMTNSGLEQVTDNLDTQVSQPTLLAFLSTPKPNAGSFFKSLRLHNVKRFRTSDEEAANAALRQLDPDGSRIWLLMSQAKLPDAVDAWVWQASQIQLKFWLPDHFDNQEHDAARLFDGIVAGLSQGLRSKDKATKSHAERILRIAILWLTEKRALRAWQITEKLRPTFFPDMQTADRLTLKAVRGGKLSELRLAVAMTGLAEQRVRTAEQERDRERGASIENTVRLESVRARVTALETQLAVAEAAVSEHLSTIAELMRVAATEKQHRGHELAATLAAQRTLLDDRIRPLLDDAVDALEIVPAQTSIAMRRLKSARAIIGETLG